MNSVKAVVGIAAAAGAVPGTVDALMHTERLILGVPQSVLSVAIAGTLIGVLLLNDKDANRITPDDDLVGTWLRLLQMSKRLLILAITIGAYALIASWITLAIGHFIPSFQGAPLLPVAGLFGVSIRRLLPKWMKLIERKTTSSRNSNA
jgi:hypothetical protein